MRPTIAVPLAVVALLSVLMEFAPAADVAIRHKADVTQLTSYVQNEATLYALRAKFSVLLPDEAEEALADDAKRVAELGVTTGEMKAQLEDLLAEASYFSTSLKYLVLSGGAVWPTDRSADFYENDALAIVNDMQDQIQQGIAADADIYPALYQLELVWAWSNGETTIDETSPLLLRDQWATDALSPYLAER